MNQVQDWGKSPRRPGRLLGLDGLRTISIALVIWSHLQGTRRFPSTTSLVRYAGDLGTLGVRVFFVISGFLITHLLLEERRRNGRISLPDFYARRGIRLLPALGVFLLGMFVADRLDWVSLTRGDWLHALTFTMNYSATPTFAVGHLWSLSVEEQFYLLWPALLLFVGVRRSLWVATGVVLTLPMTRVFVWVTFPGYRDYMDRSFETVADAMAIGCVLAGMRERLWKTRAYRTMLNSGAFALAPIVIVSLNAQEPHPYAFMLFGEPLINLTIAVVIDWTLRHPDTWVVRVLESRPARFIGVRSYSLYLWQEPFLNHNVVSFATTFPMNLAIAFTLALSSYSLVEQPLVRLRGRFSK